MIVQQLKYKNGEFDTESFMHDSDLVLAFGECEDFRSDKFYQKLRDNFPIATITGCSSSGNILGNLISHDDIVITSIKFEKSTVQLVKKNINSPLDSMSVAKEIANEFDKEKLKHLLVFSEGIVINGTELADGFNSELTVATSGGLAGDGTAFASTAVIANAPATTNIVAAIGIYGEAIIKTGSFAGFDEFGAEKIVTKSDKNIVFEIDDEPALDLYRRYLGDAADGLPLSGLYFPVSVKDNRDDKPLIRTLLGIDNDNKSLTFAGTIKQGSILKLMKSNIDKLIDNAGLAAQSATIDGDKYTGVCIAVSCVGRLIIMKQLIEEELDEVKSKLPPNTYITGFYSYGELAPHTGLKDCALHNQTMTITAIYE